MSDGDVTAEALDLVFASPPAVSGPSLAAESRRPTSDARDPPREGRFAVPGVGDAMPGPALPLRELIKLAVLGPFAIGVALAPLEARAIFVAV